MASQSAKSLMRVSVAKLGDVGALEAACTDAGSIREGEFTASWDEEVATDAFYGDVASAAERTGFAYELALTFEDIIDETFALAYGGEIVGDEIHFSGSSTPVYKTVYLQGTEIKMGGTVKEMGWHILKWSPKPGQSFALGKGQKLIQIDGTCMVVPDAATSYKIFKMYPIVADTTAPTVTMSPLDGATGVVVSANITWTFDEPIRSEDVTSRNFYVYKADGAGGAVAGALTVDAANRVVTFNPTSNLAAATAYVAVCNYVRDTAGNALAAREWTNFTTA